MTPQSIQEAFAKVQFHKDRREQPDARRRVQFCTGWTDAAQRNRVYKDKTLEQLTWRNLGFRFGRQFGKQSLERIDEAFEVLAELYERQRGKNLGPATAEQYVAALKRLEYISDTHIQMLRLHYSSPERTITATQLARATGHSHYTIANSLYGRLGRIVGDLIEFNRLKKPLGVLVTFEKRQGEWHWIMRPQVATALELLGWVDGEAILLPEEIAAATASLLEGAVCRVTVNSYERNPEARRRCIEAHGTTCTICGFSFVAAYGEVAEGYIHVHHLRPLSEINAVYQVDPVKDLRPVCPNCHAVLHRRIPAFSIEEVHEFLRGRVIRAVYVNQ